MKNIFLLSLILTNILSLYGQGTMPNDAERKAITTLIDQYSEAREKSDTVLLKNILTSDVDQLVSTGEWRIGLDASIQGMLKSSSGSPGTRTLKVENIKMLNQSVGLVDCRYEIQNSDGSIRRMWSSFLVIAEKQKWKITAIRNMLPAAQ